MSGHISEDKIVVIETKRRWSAEERRQAVEATLNLPVSAVARGHGIAKSLLFRWRKEAGLSRKYKKTETFVPVQIAAMPAISLPTSSLPPSPAVSVPHESGAIEIEFTCGTKLRINGTVKPEALKQVIAALTLR